MLPKTKTETTYGEVEFLYRDEIPEHKADLPYKPGKIDNEVVIDERTGKPKSQSAEEVDDVSASHPPDPGEEEAVLSHPPDPGEEGLWPFPNEPMGSEQTGDLILLDVGPLSVPDMPIDDLLF